MACPARRLHLLAAAAAALCALAPRPALALDHCGQVTTNQAWSQADNPHDICSAGLTVRGSTLSIQPGAIIRFNEGASLIIDAGAALVAVGDAQNAPIRFVSLQRTGTPGYWGQIRFERDALTSTIESAVISHGGKDNRPMVEVRGTATDLFNVAFTQSAAAPLAFAASALGPSTERAGSVTTRDQRCSLIRFSQVGQSHIEVDASDAVDIAADATWASFCQPYRVNGMVTVAGPVDLAPTLTLNPGVQLRFDAEGGIHTGLSADQPGHLVASGSVDVLEHVVLTGQTEAPGSWRGIELTEHSTIDNSLINVDVLYGGSDDAAMIRVRDPRALALDLTMRHAKRYPLELPSTAVDTFLGGLVVGKVRQPPIQDNGVDRALVRAKDIAVDVARSAVWGNIGAPYEIDGDLTVASDQGAEGLPAQFRILPGAMLLFADGAALRIGDPAGPRARFAAGPLPAEPLAARAAQAAVGAGAALAPDDAAAAQGGDIVLGALSGGPAGWQGLVIADTAVEVLLEGVRVENGGRDGAMVQWGKVRGSVTRSTFRGAAGYPLTLPLSHVDAVMGAHQQVMVNRNQYEGNGVDRILVQTAGSELAQRQVVLADPGAGVEFDGDVMLGGTSAPLIDVDAGVRFYLRGGKAMRIGLGPRQANVRLNEARGATAVEVHAAQPGQPHAGLVIDEGSSLREDDDAAVGLVVDGGGAGEAFVTVRGVLELVGLTVTGDALSTGATGLLVAGGGEATIEGPRLSQLAVGARAAEGARLILQKGWITACSQWGVVNEDASRCSTAARIWWGDAGGPLDPSAAEDGCMNVANETAGTRVSDDVDWAGYAIDEQLTPVGGIQGSKKAFLPFARR